jgi:hypothetical protein
VRLRPAVVGNGPNVGLQSPNTRHRARLASRYWSGSPGRASTRRVPARGFNSFHGLSSSSKLLGTMKIEVSNNKRTDTCGGAINSHPALMHRGVFNQPCRPRSRGSRAVDGHQESSHFGHEIRPACWLRDVTTAVLKVEQSCVAKGEPRRRPDRRSGKR